MIAKTERDRLRLLLEVTNDIVSIVDMREMLAAISKRIRSVLAHDYLSFTLHDKETDQLRSCSLDFPESRGQIKEGLLLPVKGTVPGKVFTERTPIRLDRLNPKAELSADIAARVLAEGLQSACVVPLVARNRSIGTLSAASRREAAFTDDDLDLLVQVGGQVAVAVENALAFQEIENLKNKLVEEKLYLQDEIRTEYFDEIIGQSAALTNVLAQVETVARTNSTVLILGETGTGKELIARALHDHSPRKLQTFVKLNCSAIPTGLLESELFGHEKGAFTGAIAQKLGRMELAHNGTLFLDEIGDVPPELQPKLLRALQEREFERLGSTRTQKVDVRLIAATNRDLAEMVANHEFRSDLYYRLNVFPIRIPPLRHRAEDIPRLVQHFAQKHSQQMGRRISTIRADDMRALQAWHWPGNVRELENFIERAVILSRGTVLEVPITELQGSRSDPADAVTLKDSEREHIIKVLRETHGKVSGPGGAAERLGLKRSTLQAKMKKLGILRDQ
jgi:formate hydrogenlyase transcriptional activator